MASSGRSGAGIGPSVSEQRTRYNSFTVEGPDNNSNYYTDQIIAVPNDAAMRSTSFAALQNHFSPEFGRSQDDQWHELARHLLVFPEPEPETDRFPDSSFGSK